MKLFKTIDYYVQLVFIIAALMINLFLLTAGQTSIDVVLGSYFLVGGWQVCSVIANFMIRAEYKVNLRKWYLVLLLLTAVIGALCLVDSNTSIFFLFALFIWSPVLAILYLVTSYRELKLLQQPRAAE